MHERRQKMETWDRSDKEEMKNLTLENIILSYRQVNIVIPDGPIMTSSLIVRSTNWLSWYTIINEVKA